MYKNKPCQKSKSYIFINYLKNTKNIIKRDFDVYKKNSNILRNAKVIYFFKYLNM